MGDTAGPLDDSTLDVQTGEYASLVNFVPDSAPDSQETCLPGVVGEPPMFAAHEEDITTASPFSSAILERSARQDLDTSVGFFDHSVENTKVQQKKILSFFSRRP